MIRATFIVAFLLAGAQTATKAGPATAGSAKTAASNRPALRITLEKKTKDGKVEAVASDHVFEQGDTVHFKLQSDFDGYLYVMDQGTSGRFASVFPSAEAGSNNRVSQGQMFSIPSIDESWFEINGPAGFDVLYFLLSPESIATPPASAFVAPGPISSMRPRCNDAVFKARGECTDINAGPAPLPKDAPLPAPLEPIASMASRDITVVKKQGGVQVGSSANKTAPVIYTFRMAHN